jgi:predicted alpha-1,2-mannosidase
MPRALAILVCMTVLAGSFAAPANAQVSARPDLASYVDPLIGTYPPGFVNPGPVVPHGMVGLGPDTEGPFNYGGYHYVNNTITGFSHTHMSAGVPRAGQIPFMPVTGNIDLTDHELPEGSPVPNYASPFSHTAETAEPGYYSVRLARYGIDAELTATLRAGMHRYTFPAGQPASVIIDAGRDLQGHQSSTVDVHEDGMVTGFVEAERSIEVYFAAVFDRPVTSAQTFTGTALSDARHASGARTGAVLGFGSDGGPLLAKVGISFVDVEGAIDNLSAEIPTWDFDGIRADARDSWNDALSAIEIEGGTDAERTSFYTALYHAQFFPNRFDDADGRYLGFDDVVRTTEFPRYTQFSLWDSYRGQNQLLSVINPDAYRDMTLSLLDMYRQGGTLPRWTFANRDPAHMSGDPVIPFIGEAWCRGLLEDLDADGDEDGDDAAARIELFDAMRERTINNRPTNYDTLGYSPTPQMSDPGKLLESTESQAGTTLEYGIAEFTLALMAEEAGFEDHRDALQARSLNYRNLLDPETKWIRPKDADGQFVRDFHPESDYGFQEGTSWQYSWLAMHDLRGLFDGMGGNEVVQDRLDRFFNLPVTGTVPVAWPKVQNQITAFGLVYKGNQYAPGNEHDLQAPFLYNYAGAPWKTQAVARGVASLFTPTPDGLPGNDDLGALSGWLVWTMLGVYPVTPGSPTYTIASPIFTKATIHMKHGDFVIDTPASSPVAKYVQSAALDGEPMDKIWFTHGDIRKGAVLTLEMGPLPDTSWGTASGAAPPSASTNQLRDFGCGAGITSESGGPS